MCFDLRGAEGVGKWIGVGGCFVEYMCREG